MTFRPEENIRLTPQHVTDALVYVFYANRLLPGPPRASPPGAPKREKFKPGIDWQHDACARCQGRGRIIPKKEVRAYVCSDCRGDGWRR